MTSAYPASQYSVQSSSVSITPSSQGSRDVFLHHFAQDDRSWHAPSAPIRSMSLATPEELPPHYQVRFLQQSPVAVGRGPVTAGAGAQSHYNDAHDAAASVPHPSTETNPVGHHGQAGQQGGFTFSQWGTYPQQSTQLIESGAQEFPREWYTGSPNLAHVREEECSPHHYQPPSRSSHHGRNPE